MATEFYNEDNLNDKVPQKIVSLLSRTGVLRREDNVEAVLGSTLLWGINNCIIALDTQMVYFQNTPKIAHARYNYTDLSSISVQKKGMLDYIYITIGGTREVMLDVAAGSSEVHKMYDFVNRKMQESKSPNVMCGKELSSADEILKFKQLLDAGVITEEEFQFKKKQLLGI